MHELFGRGHRAPADEPLDHVEAALVAGQGDDRPGPVEVGEPGRVAAVVAIGCTLAEQAGVQVGELVFVAVVQRGAGLDRVDRLGQCVDAELAGIPPVLETEVAGALAEFERGRAEQSDVARRPRESQCFEEGVARLGDLGRVAGGDAELAMGDSEFDVADVGQRLHQFDDASPVAQRLGEVGARGRRPCGVTRPGHRLGGGAGRCTEDEVTREVAGEAVGLIARVREHRAPDAAVQLGGTAPSDLAVEHLFDEGMSESVVHRVERIWLDHSGVDRALHHVHDIVDIALEDDGVDLGCDRPAGERGHGQHVDHVLRERCERGRDRAGDVSGSGRSGSTLRAP